MTDDERTRELWGDDWYPPYVATDDEKPLGHLPPDRHDHLDRERSRPPAKPAFVVPYTRWLYYSDIPLDEDDAKKRAEAESPLAEAHTEQASRETRITCRIHPEHVTLDAIFH